MLKGSLHGGQSPICNSTVGLYPAGAVGPCATTTTDAQGAFNIDPSDPSNTCGSTPADKQMYIVATGGVANNNDCGPGGGNNTALAMSTALGRFDSLPGFVVINEVTTVASVWALNQFLDTSGQNLSDPVTNQGGLANAARTLGSKNLVDVSTGIAPASFGPGVLSPRSKLYTLANILATCVNTASETSSACRQLLCLAVPGANYSASCSATPLNTTLEVAVSIARNPANNVRELFGLPSPTSPFQPTLSGPPTDWLLAVTYQGIGGLGGPMDIAIDGAGNAWITNPVFPTPAITKLDPVGVALSPSGGFTFPTFALENPSGIAIDSSGNAWIALARVPSGLTGLNPNGTFKVVQGLGFVAAKGIAINSIGQIVVTAPSPAGTSNVFMVDPTGPTVLERFDTNNFTGGVAIGAYDNVRASDTVWVVGTYLLGMYAEMLDPTRYRLHDLPGSPFTTEGFVGPWDVAVDASGNIWAPYNGGNLVRKFDPSGALLFNTSGGGLSGPWGIAMDGAGNAWVVNSGDATPSAIPSVTELDSAGNALSPTTGFQDPHMQTSFYDAIDSSGNVWVTNQVPGSVTQFIGPAAPVKTPIIGPTVAP